MEWNIHFSAIQGLLISVEKVVGPLTKIKYKGGNESKISKVQEAVNNYLSSKDFIRSKIAVKLYDSELESIVLFMLLNTDFESNTSLDIKEFAHLRNVTPQLSRCLLGNIIVDLDLTLHYSKLIAKLPIQPHLELLHELITCIRHCQPENALEHVNSLITEIIVVLCTLQDQDAADELLDITRELLTIISAVNTDWLPERKLKQIHQHMGFTFLYVLRLLRKCPVHSSTLSKLVDDLIRVAITLMQAVTINVFCVWAEVSYEEQPLQMVVSNEAYLITAHLSKYKPGLELVQMLASIAKKPKTLEKIINESDIPTMINQINKCDENQRQWFKAFINNNPLQNQDCMDCLAKWVQLCKKDDVAVILNHSISYQERNTKKLVLKCAEQLEIDDLVDVCIRYHTDKNSCNLDLATIEDELKVLLNKLESSTETGTYFTKQIHLMLLQNPKRVITLLFEKCVVNAGITLCIKSTLESIRQVVEVNGNSRSALVNVFQSLPSDLQNLTSCTTLINELHHLSYFNEETLVTELFVPLLTRFNENYSSMVNLLNLLLIFDTVDIQYKWEYYTVQFVILLLSFMEKYRCQFLNFSSTKQQIVHQCVSILLKYKNTATVDDIENIKYVVENHEIANNLNKYYINYIETGSESLLAFIYPTYNENNIIGLLEMLLPSCVEQEWVSIVNELENKIGYELTYELLTNVLLILYQLADSHKGGNKNDLTNCLKYCLEMYGIVIKEVFRKKHTNLGDEIFLTKSVCRLLAGIPPDLRNADGLFLIQMLSTESLKALKDDKKFIFSLVSIKDVTVSQMLAKKMLS